MMSEIINSRDRYCETFVHFFGIDLYRTCKRLEIDLDLQRYGCFQK